MNDAFQWTDIHLSDGLAIQRNQCGELRIAQRMPVGGATPADIPLADSDAMARLFCALAAVYGVAVTVRDGKARAVGFRS